jgi:hypothetical protein
MYHMSNVIVWDIETVPDLKGFAAANGHAGKSDDEVRAELGDKFPKHICTGALVAHREDGGRWIVDALEAPHVGERSEKDLISYFVDRIAALSPQLVTMPAGLTQRPALRIMSALGGGRHSDVRDRFGFLPSVDIPAGNGMDRGRPLRRSNGCKRILDEAQREDDLPAVYRVCSSR